MEVFENKGCPKNMFLDAKNSLLLWKIGGVRQQRVSENIGYRNIVHTYWKHHKTYIVLNSHHNITLTKTQQKCSIYEGIQWFFLIPAINIC